MIGEWVLIIFIGLGRNANYESIYFHDEKACIAAAASLPHMEPRLVEAKCFPTSASPK